MIARSVRLSIYARNECNEHTHGYGLAHLRLSLLRYVLLDKELDRHSVFILENRLQDAFKSQYNDQDMLTERVSDHFDVYILQYRFRLVLLTHVCFGDCSV